tara:strand:- start:3007 stop:4026 length:1020 start_codon:yes stop_codon:yes gene_type:complete
MSTTIAYSHKGGYWKTKYSFVACFMRSVGRKFFSSASVGATALPEEASRALNEEQKSTIESLIWKHNSKDDSKRTNFYGVLGNSGISVAFNDRVSSNKIYKSISLEGSNNIANNSVNTFVVNSDNNPNKQFSIGPVKDKGGMLYGHIGLSNLIAAGSNVRVLGTFEVSDSAPFFTSVDGGQNAIAIRINSKTNIPVTKSSVTGNSNLGVSPLSKYFFVSENGDAYSIDGKLISTGADISSASYNDNKFGLPYDLDFSLVNSSPAFILFRNSSLESEDVTAIGGGEYTKIVTLCEITPQDINGAPPRGQYAQAEIVFGNQPYELFALNVNYETTDLDHSK